MALFLKRVLRTAKKLATDRRVPRWLRPLLLVGMLPIPGPVDEVILIVALGSLLVVRPGLVRALWSESK